MWSEVGPSSAPSPADPVTFQSLNIPHTVGISMGYWETRERGLRPVLPHVPTPLIFRTWSFPPKPATGTLEGTTTAEGQLCIDEEGLICFDHAIIETSTGWAYHKDETRDFILQQTFAIKFWKLILFSTSCGKTNFWDKLLHWNFILRIIIFMDVILACIYTLY